MKSYTNLILILFTTITMGCTNHSNTNTSTKEGPDAKALEDRYTMDDFKSVRKFDLHVHINSETKTMINLARAHNFKLLNIAVDVPGFPPVEKQLEVRVKHFREDPDVVSFSSAFNLEGWDDPDWSTRVIDQLKKDFENGATSVKVWKNIGMEARDKNGNLIVLDDPKFDPVFQFIKDQGKVLLSHAGEPKNCWLPLDAMTVNNDRNYFSKNPQYHMYLHPDMPSYEDQLRHRDNMLAKHPELPFVGLHMASLEWSVDELATFLDRFPNASVDLAERISHTQYQSQRDRKKVRDFFIQYQDRIIYGTDFLEAKETKPEALENHMMDTWLNDWKYFNTDELVQVPQLDDPVQGLALPKGVVDKIYWENAVVK